MQSTAHSGTMDRRELGRQIVVESVRSRSRPPMAMVGAGAGLGDVHGRKRISRKMSLSLSMVHDASGWGTVCGNMSGSDGSSASVEVKDEDH